MKFRPFAAVTFAASLICVASCSRGRVESPALQRMPRIALSEDRSHFILVPGGQRFTLWGVNYDHDENGRLIEDYWTDEWGKVEEDFAEIRELGANIVRVHLQFGKFMTGPQTADPQQLRRLRRLLDLAGRLGLYLDITGLGCYHK